MKKILLQLSFLFYFINMIGQTPIQISGELSPAIYRVYNYRIVSGFHGVSGTKATWKITNGYFNNDNKSTTLEQEVDLLSADVVWTEEGKGGSIFYTYRNGSVSYEGRYNVLIQKEGSSGGDTGGYVLTVTSDIPNKKVSLIKKRYSITIGGSMSKFIKSVEWSQSENIKLESKNLTNTQVFIVGVKPGKVRLKASVLNYSGHLSDEFVDFDVIDDLSVISKSSIICAKDNPIDYSISDILEEAIIDWKPIINSHLISGQGARNSIFKASGNGLVRIKAVVKYDAKEYIVENSKVWVGIPEFENPYDAVTLNVEKGMPYVCQFNVPGNVQGENTYTWSIKGPATITRTDNKTGSVNFLVNANARGLISLTGSVQNRCGKCLKDQWIEAFLGNGGGILKSIPQSISEDKPQQTSSPQSVKIYSFATGYLLYQEKNVTNFNIQNTNLNPDIYILEITDSEGNTTRQKVAKNNY